MLIPAEIVSEDKRELVDFLNEHYDYCYLYAMHEINRVRRPTTIVTGLSYGLNGVNAEYIDGDALNMCMHSQDIYYDFLHMKKALKNNNAIQNCIITFSYYSLFYDLSMGGAQDLCCKTYNHLFHDLHHCEIEPKDDYSLPEYYRFRNFSYLFFDSNPSYYIEGIYTREMRSRIMFGIDCWKDLGDEKKDAISRGEDCKTSQPF